MADDLTPEQRLLRAIFGAQCDGSAECPAPVHQFPCEAHEPRQSPAAEDEPRHRARGRKFRDPVWPPADPKGGA